MIAPDALISELMLRVRRDFYSKRPPKQWYQQQDTIKKALTFPAAWLEERKVPLSGARYSEIVGGILDTARRHGQLDRLAYPSAYILKCVQEHMAHHGDEYYQEGKGIRNRVSVFMTDVERAHKGDDATVPVLAGVHAALAVGKSKGRPKATPAIPAPDLFAASPAPAEVEKPMRKHRSDSVFARVTQEQRDEVERLLRAGKSYDDVVLLCQAWGVKTSRAALCDHWKKIANFHGETAATP